RALLDVQAWAMGACCPPRRESSRRGAREAPQCRHNVPPKLGPPFRAACSPASLARRAGHQSDSVREPGTFLQYSRLSAMILVECRAAWVKVEYWTTSR